MVGVAVVVAVRPPKVTETAANQTQSEVFARCRCRSETGPAEMSDNCCVGCGLAAFARYPPSNCRRREHIVSPSSGRYLVELLVGSYFDCTEEYRSVDVQTAKLLREI